MLKKKIYFCMFLLGLLLCNIGVRAQSDTEAQVIPVNFPQSSGYFTSLSDNGLWATSVSVDESNATLVGYPYLINATTGEMKQLWTGSNAIGFTANDVTDDGKMVVGSADGHPAYYDVDAGKWVNLPGDGEALCVTPDGSRIAGFAFGGDDGQGLLQNMELPRVWDRQEDGTYRQLDVDSELEGFPRKDKFGSLTNMRRIQNMSADGKILAGAMNFVYVGQNCYYVYNSETKKTVYVDNLLADNYKGGSFIDESNMSNNGAYMTGLSQIIDNSTTEEYNAAYRLNITDGSLELFNTYSDEKDRGGFAVSNNGTIFASSPAVNPVRYLYVLYGKLWYGLDEIMSGRYGINIYEKINQEMTGYAVDVSDDEHVLIGMSQTMGYGYIIRLPETFTEATSKIDPLEAFSVYPAAGSAFARFKEATITFSKPTSVVSGSMAQLLDENGQLVRNFNISPNSDGISFVVGGIPTTLEAGKKYTVYFPAGTFQLTADNSYKSKEIRINYVGRENTPAKVTSMSPANGANVSEISTSQPVRLTFDMDVKVAKNKDVPAVAYLYEGDSETPICDLVISTSGKQVALAPALRRYLKLGVDYKVVIPEDAITDIMGDCGNDEITINYHGMYEAEVVPGGELFFDDFNDPSVSIARYLLYEGDHNTPASVPASWEFDTDNTPWNFTIRSTEETSDYCAASHSMYSPSGKSDDWMSLPQQYIENGDFYLSFDAQSFQFSKNDSLKVYILEEDGGYVNFTQDLYNKFKTNGKLVFKEKLTPGKSQDELEGDWTNFEIPLSDYAGKYIYIAFVNDNENQSAVFLDNVKIYYRGDFILSTTTAESVVDQQAIDVTAQVNVSGDKTYNDLTATVTSGDFTSTYTATGLNLTKDSPAYTIKFPEQMPLKVGEENSYTVTVNLDGTQLSRTSSVKDLAFQTTKRVLVEEATGQWCTNCPRGILALENLEQLFGDDVVSIGVHGTGNSGQDIFAYDSYCNSLGFTAFPSGVVNRIDTLYQPTAVIYGETGSYYSFNSPSGNMTFLDIVQREFSMNPIAEADINVTKADYDTQKKTVTVDGGVNYAVNLKNLNQNILFVIVENGLEGVQQNNCYTSTDPLMGRFGKGGELGQPNPTVTFNHVARRVLDEYYTGMAGLIPVNVTANSPVEFTLERTAPDNVVNWANAELVVAVLNNNTGQVVNVVKVPFTIDGTSGIGSVNASGEDISINSENGMINVNASGDVNVAVYDASGSLVGTKAGSGQVSIATANGGLYIVKATVDGASVVKKVVVR